MQAMVVQVAPQLFEMDVQSHDAREVARVYAQYDALLFVSDRARRDWLELPELAGKPGYYVPNCAREDLVRAVQRIDRNALRHKLGMRHDAFVVTCVAHVQYRKGQDLVVERLEQAVKAMPEISMVFVGRIEPVTGEAIVERASRSPDANHVKFVGEKENALEYILAADVCILPSRTEGMPVTILEAMALGKPVIASDVGGIPELIEHEVTGLMFSHSEPERLIEHLSSLWQDRARREKMGERGKERYWLKFCFAEHARSYRTAVEGILGIAPPV